MKWSSILVVAAALAAATSARASGHGPVFALATPTNARHGRSFDIGLMGRAGSGASGAMLRGMFGYGITEDVQVSLSMPVVFSSAAFVPARTTGMMPGSGDVEGIVAWRFHRRGTGVGSRFESTAYGGVIVPGPQRPAGMARDLNRAPGFYTAAATGFASRSHYVWGGAGYSRFAEAAGDRRSDLFSYSLVWGYRPPPLRKEYPHWDWRLFVELTGERAGRMRRAGVEHLGTGGHQIFLGPSTLGIYKNYAIEAGVQFPVHRDVRSAHVEEQIRYAINFSYFF